MFQWQPPHPRGRKWKTEDFTGRKITNSIIKRNRVRIDIVCRYCGKSFKDNHRKHQKYCSRECVGSSYKYGDNQDGN